MPRNSAVAEAGIFGLGGAVLLSVGIVVAAALVSTLDFWLAAVPALLVWGVAAYYAMSQFAHGVYTVVEDATAR